MKKIILGLASIALVFGLIGSVGAINTASKKDQKKKFSLPENAVEVSHGVFYLGESMNKGEVVEGYAFVHYAKSTAKSKPVWDDTVDIYKFMRGGLKWANTIQYKINPSYIGGLDQNDVEITLNASLEIWDSEISFEFFDSITTTTETSVGFDGTNIVIWGYLGSSGTIAQNTIWFNRRTKEIVESDVVFNTHYIWSAVENCPDNAMDLQNIATHEFGHNGLGDLYMPKSVELTMHGYSDYGETKKQDLGTGDVSGIQELYGN
ncbi:matrixin family metalloprotease [Candidatus Parcubacteria bacterium]|nr:matrixin family metalloprotease [Candidatus Parcubacteria bacterium]